MPYIPQKLREKAKTQPSNPGELNYAITNLINYYLDQGPINYQICNDITGALEACKLEFYRRIVSPYENKKIKDNGDVYYYADLSNKPRIV